MTKTEFHDHVASAFIEHFPKISTESRDDFIATLIDDLQGSDLDLEDDLDEDRSGYDRSEEEDY